jgi:uncharacterized protein Veg
MIHRSTQGQRNAHVHTCRRQAPTYTSVFLVKPSSDSGRSKIVRYSATRSVCEPHNKDYLETKNAHQQNAKSNAEL